MEDYDSGTLLPHQFYLCKVQSFIFYHAFLNFIAMQFCQFLIYVFENFEKMNVTLQILDMFSYQDSISHTNNFPGD